MKAEEIIIGNPLQYPEMEVGVVKIVVLDGVNGKVTIAPAAEHGLTTIETSKGAAVKLNYHQGFLI